MKVLNINGGDVAVIKETFRKGCVKLPPCLNPSVSDFLSSTFKNNFEKRSILEDLSSEYTISNHLVNVKLKFIFNSPDFLQWMSELTGKIIRISKHRLYYNDATCASLPWHDDSYDKDGRVAAIRFELSDSPYEGGSFLFKDEKSEYKFDSLQLGESILFKIEFHKYYHMVTPITKGIRKSLVVFLCE